MKSICVYYQSNFYQINMKKTHKIIFGMKRYNHLYELTVDGKSITEFDKAPENEKFTLPVNVCGTALNNRIYIKPKGGEIRRIMTEVDIINYKKLEPTINIVKDYVATGKYSEFGISSFARSRTPETPKDVILLDKVNIVPVPQNPTEWIENENIKSKVDANPSLFMNLFKQLRECNRFRQYCFDYQTGKYTDIEFYVHFANVVIGMSQSTLLVDGYLVHHIWYLVNRLFNEFGYYDEFQCLFGDLFRNHKRTVKLQSKYRDSCGIVDAKTHEFKWNPTIVAFVRFANLFVEKPLNLTAKVPCFILHEFIKYSISNEHLLSNLWSDVCTEMEHFIEVIDGYTHDTYDDLDNPLGNVLYDYVEYVVGDNNVEYNSRITGTIMGIYDKDLEHVFATVRSEIDNNIIYVKNEIDDIGDTLCEYIENKGEQHAIVAGKITGVLLESFSKFELFDLFYQKDKSKLNEYIDEIVSNLNVMYQNDIENAVKEIIGENNMNKFDVIMKKLNKNTIFELHQLLETNKFKGVVEEILAEINFDAQAVKNVIMRIVATVDECDYVFDELLSIHGKQGVAKMVNGVTFKEDVDLIVREFIKSMLCTSIKGFVNYSENKIVRIAQKLVNNINNVVELRRLLNDQQRLKTVVKKIAKKNF